MDVPCNSFLYTSRETLEAVLEVFAYSSQSQRPVTLYCKIWRLGLSNSCLQGLATYYSFKEIL